MVPFQSDINRSSPLSSPYEHASVQHQFPTPNRDATVIPAPRPFSPFSNSSNSLKFRGTFAPILARAG